MKQPRYVTPGVVAFTIILLTGSLTAQVRPEGTKLSETLEALKRQRSFAPTEDGVKWMPDVVPAKVTIDSKGDAGKGTIHFAGQTTVNAQDISYRPTGKIEARDLRILLTKPSLPMPTTPKVSIEAEGNYL